MSRSLLSIRNPMKISHCTALASPSFHKNRFPNHSNFHSASKIHRSLVSQYAYILDSCIITRAINPGKQLHSHLYQIGLGLNLRLATKLVHLYCVCNSSGNAHHLFDRIPKRNVFLWNILIQCYSWNGPYEAAISLYPQIFNQGIMPDRYTYTYVLKACSSLTAIREGKKIHNHVIQTKRETDVFIGAALIDMYAKCGSPRSAREVFDKIEVRDVVLWNSMLSGYSQNGCPVESLTLFGEMVLAGLRPTEATLVTVVSASADISDLPSGKEIHGFSLRHGFQSNDKVRTTLVDMYAKSGFVKVARTLFEQLREKRVPSWNAMITGYAMHGHAFEALALFEDMRKIKETMPNHITFVGVLGACSRGGLLDKGLNFFDSMVKEYGIEPTVQHYTCMVDLLGHCGELGNAYHLIKQMKVVPDSGVWGALLNSCKIHGKVELAEIAVKELEELEPDAAGKYVILSNIYAQSGNWDGVARVRDMMIDKGIKKNIACSWIEVKNKVHAFLSGDTSHPDSNAIYAELKRVGRLMAEAGYVPSTGSVFHDVDEDEKVNMVCSHSERLAIAFGLISTESGTRLLITKNLRICEDCHIAVKFISEITVREIIVRDVNRFHHFKDGKCSCGDFW